MKKQNTQFNHETWHTCHACGCEYDLRVRSHCPQCKTANNQFTSLKPI